MNEIGGTKDISTRSSSTSTRTRIAGETDSSGRKMPRKSRRCSNEAQKDAGNHVGKKTITFHHIDWEGFLSGLTKAYYNTWVIFQPQVLTTDDLNDLDRRWMPCGTTIPLLIVPQMEDGSKMPWFLK